MDEGGDTASLLAGLVFTCPVLRLLKSLLPMLGTDRQQVFLDLGSSGAGNEQVSLLL